MYIFYLNSYIKCLNFKHIIARENMIIILNMLNFKHGQNNRFKKISKNDNFIK